MGQPLYMQSVVDQNIIMWRMTVLITAQYTVFHTDY